MAKSPGHRQHPEHKVEEQPVQERLQVAIGGEIVADSSDVIEVVEDGSPPRYYFPRGDVKMEALEPSSTTTKCPYKGTASYYGLRMNGKKLDDAVWSYEEPYDEHAALKDRLAFYVEKLPEIEIRTA
ncbi:MAG TPA: DUF427 domain-containing protein [Gammaproteobacteria bacterium]|nr:DUF427 domain-containing protein [Gammaproteobacteria bacterium]